MKCVLISIRPKWCSLIALGKKTIEVRKTIPKIDTPFKCYIYCTKGGDDLMSVNGVVQSINEITIDLTEDSTVCSLNGEVIGEFICDGIFRYSTMPVDGQTISTEDMIKQSCVSYKELQQYEDNYTSKDFCINPIGLYGWHISNLKIYDKPKNLSVFGWNRPPQSWGYAPDLQNA